jgi:hypothetical protein
VGNNRIVHQTIERSMTEADRRRLLNCMPLAPSPFWPFQKYQYGLQVIGEAFGVLVLVIVFVGFGDLRLAHGIIGGVGVLGVWWSLNLKRRVIAPLRAWRKVNERACFFRSAVAAAQTIRVHRVEANAVVAVTYDEGTIYLFDIGSSETYWIDPYCMIPGTPPKEWPNGKFEVIEVPGCDEEVGPFCEGKQLRPRETIEIDDLFGHYEFEPPTEGIIHQSLETFLEETRVRNRSAAGVR